MQSVDFELLVGEEILQQAKGVENFAEEEDDELSNQDQYYYHYVVVAVEEDG